MTTAVGRIVSQASGALAVRMAITKKYRELKVAMVAHAH